LHYDAGNGSRGGFAIAKDPDPREVLANERTFLSWLRTGISLMAFGFVVSKFNLFLQLTAHRRVQHGIFGLLLVAGGLIINVFGTWQFRRNYIRLHQGKSLSNIQFPLITGVLMIVMGVSVFIYLMKTSGN
jgi:putative membrane protein